MSWEHAIARELKKRDNPVYYAWFSGEVTSPVQTTDEEGHVNYSGPTIVSCFDGAVQLRADRLQQIPGADPEFSKASLDFLHNLLFCRLQSWR